MANKYSLGIDVGSTTVKTVITDADGNIVYDVKGEERKGLTVDDLLLKFRAGTGKDLDNDRILLS